jgi:hypothetical protein
MYRATDHLTLTDHRPPDVDVITDRAQKRAEHDRLWDDELKADESARLWAAAGWTAV